jgi:hypothetical protein
VNKASVLPATATTTAVMEAVEKEVAVKSAGLAGRAQANTLIAICDVANR